MNDQWYYYFQNKQEGPVSVDFLKEIIQKGQLDHSAYVWTKGFADWKMLKDVPTLFEEQAQPSQVQTLPGKKENTNVQKTSSFKEGSLSGAQATSTSSSQTIDSRLDEVIPTLGVLKEDDKCIYLKTGFDRGGTPKEYGPYDLTMLKKLYQTSRINGRTLVYFPGLDCWRVLAIFGDFEDIFHDMPPIIQESDRRRWERKPFTARLFFTSDNQFYEGVCKDLSVGGMQVLLYQFPGKVGDVIKMNVHPENPDHHFVAKARIVRIAKSDGAISMEFIDLNEGAKKAVSNYIQYGD